MPKAIMMQRAAFLQRHAHHRLLGGSGCLADGFRNFARLAMAKADTALAIADHHECRKAEALAALHGLGDAIDVDELLDELLATILILRATATTAVITPATTAATITTATVVATTTTATAALSRWRFRLGTGHNALNHGFISHA
jgi:hypothetical protein